MEDTGAQHYVWDYGTMGRDPIKVYVYMRNTGRKLRRAEKVRKVRQEEKSSGQPEVEWTLGALVFDLRLARRNGRRWQPHSLIGKVPGGGSTLQTLPPALRSLCANSLSVSALLSGLAVRCALFCSMQDALLDLVRPLT